MLERTGSSETTSDFPHPTGLAWGGCRGALWASGDGLCEPLTQAVLVAVCRPRTAGAGGRRQGRPCGCREQSPTALDSTATTKRRWLPVDRTVRVSAYRTGRTARPQDLDGGRSQVVVAHPGLEPGGPQDLNHGLGHRVQDPARPTRPRSAARRWWWPAASRGSSRTQA
jgi:hypothetical protein